MKVYFIGAGPGAPDLITLRGAKILSQVSMVLYAGSLVSKDMLVHCRKDAEIIDTASLDLDQQEAHFRRAQEQGWDVARLHTGDPAIYGAIAEQMKRLDALGITYEVVPGVSSFLAAAAALPVELTKPGVSQTIILTRTTGRSSPMPKGESIPELAKHCATMSIFLSGARLGETVAELLQHYPPTTPMALVYKATWPQQRIYQGTLGTVMAEIDMDEWKLSTLLLVGDALSDELPLESALYAAEFGHGCREGKSKEKSEVRK